MKQITLLTLILGMLLTLSCSNDNGFNTLSDETLNGNVFGEDFIASNGNAILTRGEFIAITLSVSTLSCNGASEATPLYVTIAVPDRVGFHKNVLAIFGKSGHEPVTELDALVEIIEVNETQVVGKIRSKNNKDNRVEGSFAVTICGG
ncbi:hypothetical protein [Ascidiimonas sp. W6]|uniref:hypothetical protein n=1 Tax=Ascidiimonas meishanensis TaxID=3128903 RepID=UPI0030ECD25F